MRVAVLLALALVAVSPGAEAQLLQTDQIYGRWLSENKRGVIDLYPCGNTICGKLVWLREPNYAGAPRVDVKNPDPALRRRPLCGLVVLGGFRHMSPQLWTDGRIYDPQNGKTYRATLFLEGLGLLRLRGYIGTPFLGRSETWTRPDASYGAC
ncbi:MAG TPA: DUF2147 domain-containing protein [Stellaceae bacterium]|nr:DUF2147 domain-containing protein [Stellaceae bacterium]